MDHHGDRGRGGYRARGRGRSNYEERSYDNGGGYTSSSFGGDDEGSGFGRNNTTTDFGGISGGGYGFGQDEGFGRNKANTRYRGGYQQNTRNSRWNGAANAYFGGYGATVSSFGAQENATSPNDIHNLPRTDAAFSSGGFGTHIDDNSFFNYSQPSAPPLSHTGTQNLSRNTGLGSAAGGFGAAPTHHLRATGGKNTGAQQNAEQSNGFGAVQQSVTHVNGYGPRKGNRSDSQGNRRGRQRTASTRPSLPPTAGSKSPDENDDPNKLALVEKMKELLNDDGGVYTSDEEDKLPISEKDDRAAEATSPPVAIESEDAFRTEMSIAPIRHQADYGIPRDGSRSSQPSRATDRPMPQPTPAAQEIAHPKIPEVNDEKKAAIADSILMAILSDQHLRQILKAHSPVLFDNMVKHVAVIAETRST